MFKSRGSGQTAWGLTSALPLIVCSWTIYLTSLRFHLISKRRVTTVLTSEDYWVIK